MENKVFLLPKLFHTLKIQTNTFSGGNFYHLLFEKKKTPPFLPMKMFSLHWISHLENFVFTSGEIFLIDLFFLSLNLYVWKQVDF